MDTMNTLIGLSSLIAASAAAVVSIITALKQVPSLHRGQVEIKEQNVDISSIADGIKEEAAGIRKEVKTYNELTLGQLGEAEETRRVQNKAPEDRTSRENRHLDEAEERSTGA
jgi:hypothetical protein